MMSDCPLSTHHSSASYLVAETVLDAQKSALACELLSSRIHEQSAMCGGRLTCAWCTFCPSTRCPCSVSGLYSKNCANQFWTTSIFTFFLFGVGYQVRRKNSYFVSFSRLFQHMACNSGRSDCVMILFHPPPLRAEQS